MKDEQSHSIQKVYLEITVGSTKQAYEVKDRIDDFLKDRLFPAIEAHLESLYQDSSVQLHAENITLDVNCNDPFDVADITRQIQEQLDKTFVVDGGGHFSIPSDKQKHLSSSQQAEKTLLYFLEYGHYPWWIEDPSHPEVSVNALLYECLEEPSFIKSVEKLLLKASVKKRMLLQVSDAFLAILLSRMGENNSFQFLRESSIENKIASLPKIHRIVIWNLMMEVIAGNYQEPRTAIEKWMAPFRKEVSHNECEIISKIFQHIDLQHIIYINLYDYYNKEIVESVDANIPDAVPNSPLETTPQQASGASEAANHDLAKNEDDSPVLSAADKEVVDMNGSSEIMETVDKLFPPDEESKPIEKEPYYVQNGGLILLHPFLKPFLTNCGLLGAGNTITDRDTTIHLLHYLATGKEQQFEALQLMEKFLCGMPLAFPVNREIILTTELKTKAEELLTAVLGHLPQLKSTSITLFQNEFLQRPGKLILDEGKPRLIVERRTQDILLDNLSWNLSLVQLPWIKELIFVDW